MSDKPTEKSAHEQSILESLETLNDARLVELIKQDINGISSEILVKAAQRVHLVGALMQSERVDENETAPPASTFENALKTVSGALHDELSTRGQKLASNPFSFPVSIITHQEDTK
jgi:hypothetical protein